MDVMYELDYPESDVNADSFTAVSAAVSDAISQPEVSNSDMHKVAFSRMSTMQLEDPLTECVDDQTVSGKWLRCSNWNEKNCVLLLTYRRSERSARNSLTANWIWSY